MPPALKASWTVVAGIIPGQPMNELARQWNYTSLDYEEDRRNGNAEDNIFTARVREATEYLMQMNDPRRVNWAVLEFIWY
jgi:hypothetical protein